jgi:hypothetical protein
VNTGLILLAVVVGLWLLHRLALWMEDRGWIYWTRSRGHSTRAGNALLEVQGLLEPQKRHVIEMKRDLKAEQDAQGDTPGVEPEEASGAQRRDE